MSIIISATASLGATLYLAAYTVDAQLVPYMGHPCQASPWTDAAKATRNELIAHTRYIATCFHTLLLCMASVVPTSVLPAIHAGLHIAHELAMLEQTGFTAPQLLNCLLLLSMAWVTCDRAYKAIRHGNASIVFGIAVLMVKTMT